MFCWWCGRWVGGQQRWLQVDKWRVIKIFKYLWLQRINLIRTVLGRNNWSFSHLTWKHGACQGSFPHVLPCKFNQLQSSIKSVFLLALKFISHFPFPPLRVPFFLCFPSAHTCTHVHTCAFTCILPKPFFFSFILLRLTTVLTLNLI